MTPIFHLNEYCNMKVVKCNLCGGASEPPNFSKTFSPVSETRVTVVLSAKFVL